MKNLVNAMNLNTVVSYRQARFSFAGFLAMPIFTFLAWTIHEPVWDRAVCRVNNLR